MRRKCAGENCLVEYDDLDRRGKPGKISLCEGCADDESDVVKYTGNMVFDHKTTAVIQINTDPALTQYIKDATKLKGKVANLGHAHKVSHPVRGEGRCLVVSGSGANYKGKN